MKLLPSTNLTRVSPDDHTRNSSVCEALLSCTSVGLHTLRYPHLNAPESHSRGARPKVPPADTWDSRSGDPDAPQATRQGSRRPSALCSHCTGFALVTGVPALQAAPGHCCNQSTEVQIQAQTRSESAKGSQGQIRNPRHRELGDVSRLLLGRHFAPGFHSFTREAVLELYRLPERAAAGPTRLRRCHDTKPSLEGVLQKHAEKLQCYKNRARHSLCFLQDLQIVLKKVT
ncbi:hypothetical protein H920_13146 [Fukomys damarensis]|uniref:Uncharacterized protein n=1 Tax=Fukomys damarensis TaxID=885580 RepID=A0A091D550_FUKDA|nr:hypothetical protein H920_13146 [Fukomys damarensis]